MRFVLMTEPQQGMSYADQLAIGQARRGERLRCVLPVGPLRQLPGRGRPAHDRRLDGPRRPRPRDRADRARRARLAGHVPPSRARSPRSSTTVDEMSGGRIEVGVGAGWNDDEHRQLGLAFPPIERAGRPAGGPAGDPARAVGRARRLVVRGHHRDPGRGLAVPAAPGRRARPAARRRSAARGRGSSSAARARRGRTGSPRATPTSSTCRSSSPDKAAAVGRGARRGVRGRSGATRRRSPARRWPACSSGGPRTRSARASRRCSTAFGADARGRRGVARGAPPALGLRHARTRRAPSSTRFAEAGIERIMLQDFLPWDLDMVDVMGEELVGRA